MYNTYRYIGGPASHGRSRTRPRPVGISPVDPTAHFVSAVPIKLPLFWPGDALAWFAQVEAQFSMRHITNQGVCFDYVVATLAPEFATEVQDLLLAPPDADPYNVLKAQLIQRIPALEQRCLQQLFTVEEFRDKKPSQLLSDTAGPTQISSCTSFLTSACPARSGWSWPLLERCSLRL